MSKDLEKIVTCPNCKHQFDCLAKEKVYTYEVTNKDGKKVNKQVVRKYTNKKDTSNTLQNKEHKDALISAISDQLDVILELPEHKRINHIRMNCLPKNISASYNTLKSIWISMLNSMDITPTENTQTLDNV